MKSREKFMFCTFIFGVIISLVVITLRNIGDLNISPYDNFLVAPVSQFGDFYGVQDEWNRLGWSGIGYGISYFPTMYLFMEFFSFIEPRPQTLVVLYLLVLTMLSAGLIWRILKHRTFKTKICYLVAFFLSYPVMMIYSTGNLEGIVLVLVLFWFYFLQIKRYSLAAAFLGVAVSIKLVPIVFLFCLFAILSKKQWIKSFVIISFVVLSSNIFSLLFLPTGILDKGVRALPSILSNIKASQQKYAELMYYSESGTHFGHSLLNGIHAFFGESFLPTRNYGVVTFLFLFFLILLIFLVNHFKFPKTLNFQLFLLIAAIFACLAVPTSTDYKLWYFFIPILNAASIHKSKLDWPTLISSTTLFAKPYLYSGTQPWASATSYLTPLIMSGLLLYFSVNSLIALSGRRNHSNETPNRI